MNEAVIYAWFSSDKQTESSIEAQVRACREYAAAHSLHVMEVYADEAISGAGAKTASRRTYQRLLRDASKGQFDTILIHKYDRIARNLGEHVNLEQRLNKLGVTLIATAQDFGSAKEAKIMRAITWSLSEYYLDNLSEETKKGHRETALKGLHNGGYAPFGYDVVNQQYVINKLEAGYVRKLFAAALERRGFVEIIEEMDAAGIRGKRGRPIKYPQIYEILRNEKYTGVYLYSADEEKDREKRREKPHAIRIENALPVIIDRAQFLEVQKIMDGRKQTGHKSNYLCSGLVFCECGAKMHAMKSERKGHTYHYFVCSKKCGAPVIKMGEIDKAALQYLRDLLNEENQQRITQAIRKYQAGDSARMDEFKTVLQKRIVEKRRQYDALLSNLSTGKLPASVVTDIGEEMEALKSQIATLENTEPPKDFTVEQIRAWLEAIKAAPDEKAVHLLVERIDIKSKTVFNIQSTLETVLSESGCGGRI